MTTARSPAEAAATGSAPRPHSLRTIALALLVTALDAVLIGAALGGVDPLRAHAPALALLTIWAVGGIVLALRRPVHSQDVVERADQHVKHAGERDEGRITYSLSSTITGTATDNLGATYTFSYQLRFKNPSLIPGSGIAIDNFTLTGTGAADGMSTFFRARVTFDSGANPIGFEIFEQTGDPFHCDPL